MTTRRAVILEVAVPLRAGPGSSAFVWLLTRSRASSNPESLPQRAAAVKSRRRSSRLALRGLARDAEAAAIQDEGQSAVVLAEGGARAAAVEAAAQPDEGGYEALEAGGHAAMVARAWARALARMY